MKLSLKGIDAFGKVSNRAVETRDAVVVYKVFLNGG
jgi:hypothetical protein